MPAAHDVRFGIHAGQQGHSYADLLELWRRSEELGYDWASVFDHFRPPDGDARTPCMEGFTLLSALAAQTERIRCAILVAGTIYRHPALLAAIAATLDHVAGGRLELGLGATWHDGAQPQYGIRLPEIGQRMDLLDETALVVRLLLTEESVSFSGRHVTLDRAELVPKPLQERLPLVIGGAGERRLLRIAAKHADVWNTGFGGLDAYRRKLAVFEDRCQEVGRDPGAVRRSVLARIVLAESAARLDARSREATGLAAREAAGRGILVTTPGECVDLLRELLDVGAHDVLLNIKAPIDWTTLEVFAAEVAPALR